MAKDPRKRLAEHDEMLPVKLELKDITELGRRIGEKHAEFDQHEVQAASTRTRLKAEEARLREEIDKMAHALRTGYEPRAVRVEAWADYSTGKLEEIRTDTSEVLNRRPLTPAERQGEFDLGEWKDQLEQLGLRLMQEKEREDVAKKRANDRGD